MAQIQRIDGVFELRQRSLQYFTSFHTFSHFLRQVNGWLHTTQIFSGRSDFFTPRMNYVLSASLYTAKTRSRAKACSTIGLG